MKIMEIAGRKFIFEDYGQGVLCKLNGEEKNGVLCLRICMEFPERSRPGKASLKFSMPALGTDGIWTACGGLNRWLTPDWGPVVLHARSVSEYPVLSVVSFDDKNVFTASAADTPCTLSVGYREENSLLVFEAVWPSETGERSGIYRTELVFDFRRLHFAGCVRHAAERLEKKYGLEPAPASAFAPVFSTWYCFHQEVYRERLLAECREAKNLGLEAVILDDGWETEDNGRGFGYTGDYRPAAAKVGDIRSLTAELRAMGLKTMIWFSLAFAGDFSESTPRYRGMTLYHDDVQNAYVVDPRFAAVRAHIVGYCTEAVCDWGFDGLKLDFIDSFRLSEENVVREGTDCVSLEEGTTRLIDELKEALKSAGKEVLIEFRQKYVGPEMQRLGNMLRVGDCPGSLLQNRVSAIDLRLIAGGRAVHADPLEWNSDEKPETVAIYFINLIFSVLQYSAFPSGLSREQRAVSVRYIRFMKAYEDILLHGTLEPKGVLFNYLSCKAVGERGAVVALYAPVCTELKENKIIILNGSGADCVTVDVVCPYDYTAEDCFGNFVGKGKAEGVMKICVPSGGIVCLDKSMAKDCPREI